MESFALTPEAAEALIMRARLAMGWIEPEPEVDEAIEDELADEDSVLAETGESA